MEAWQYYDKDAPDVLKKRIADLEKNATAYELYIETLKTTLIRGVGLQNAMVTIETMESTLTKKVCDKGCSTCNPACGGFIDELTPWVSAKERLPVGIKDKRTPYLVKTIDVYGVALWREYDSGWDWESDCGEVVKWMPIP